MYFLNREVNVILLRTTVLALMGM
jgi:hypothetical protein